MIKNNKSLAQVSGGEERYFRSWRTPKEAKSTHLLWREGTRAFSASQSSAWSGPGSRQGQTRNLRPSQFCRGLEPPSQLGAADQNGVVPENTSLGLLEQPVINDQHPSRSPGRSSGAPADSTARRGRRLRWAGKGEVSREDRGLPSAESCQHLCLSLSLTFSPQTAALTFEVGEYELSAPGDT